MLNIVDKPAQNVIQISTKVEAVYKNILNRLSIQRTSENSAV